MEYRAKTKKPTHNRRLFTFFGACLLICAAKICPVYHDDAMEFHSFFFSTVLHSRTVVYILVDVCRTPHTKIWTISSLFWKAHIDKRLIQCDDGLCHCPNREMVGNFSRFTAPAKTNTNQFSSSLSPSHNPKYIRPVFLSSAYAFNFLCVSF